MDDLSDVNLLIATPCYGGLVYEGYLRSLLELQKILLQLNIKFSIYTIGNESLITRARNSIVALFLGNKDLTHLLFIDSDITFSPESVIRFLRYRKPVLGGAYPKKHVDLNLTKNSLKRNPDISEPDLLAQSLHYAVNVISESNSDQSKAQIHDGFVKVSNIATGFLMIQKEVILELVENFPNEKYENDCEGYDSPETKDNFYTFFDTMVHPTSKRYLSEDYAFSQKWIDIGGEIWLDLLCPLTHTGTFNFKGNVLKSFEPQINQNT
jgi:hypothetical protein